MKNYKDIEEMINHFQDLIYQINQKQTESLPNSEKTAAIRMILNELEHLITPITKELGQKNDQQYLPLQTHFVDLLNEYQRLDSQYKTNGENGSVMLTQSNPKPLIMAHANEESNENGESQEQQQIDRDDEISYITNETREIVAAMRALQETSEMVNRELQTQSNILNTIDGTVVSSVNTMEQGNKDLEKAKEYQTKCRI